MVPRPDVRSSTREERSPGQVPKSPALLLVRLFRLACSSRLVIVLEVVVATCVLLFRLIVCILLRCNVEFLLAGEVGILLRCNVEFLLVYAPPKVGLLRANVDEGGWSVAGNRGKAPFPSSLIPCLNQVHLCESP